MRHSSPFRIRKIKRYRGARYASESPENMIGYAAWLSWAFPQKLVRGAVTLLLLAGLSMGLASCGDEDYEDHGPTDGIPPDGDYYSDGDLDTEDNNTEHYDITDGIPPDGDYYSDGDLDTEDDNTEHYDITDGKPDGDYYPDGDFITDGDKVDHYDLTDGIDIDGDYSDYYPDGDLDTDGEDHPDGDLVTDGDNHLDYDMTDGLDMESYPKTDLVPSPPKNIRK